MTTPIVLSDGRVLTPEEAREAGRRAVQYKPTEPLTDEQRAEGEALWAKIQRQRVEGTGGHEEIPLDDLGPGDAP